MSPSIRRDRTQSKANSADVPIAACRSPSRIEMRHCLNGAVAMKPLRIPITAPPRTSVGKCDPRRTRLNATKRAVTIQSGPKRGNRLANTVATAKLAVLCPDGKESRPDVQEGVICQSPEWMNFGRGLPMRCFSPLASNAAMPWAISD